jgi:hypothetical protein
MSKPKRSSRQYRREPIRRHLPSRQPPTAAGDVRDAVRPGAGLVLADVDTLALGALRTIDVELTPLYAMLSALHQVLGGEESHSAVIASAQMTCALGLLGCAAELIVACTSVCQGNGGSVSLEEIGGWRHPPVIRPDATTDGHVVVWTGSFSRCIDLGISQSAMLRRAARTGEAQALPAVLPADSRDALLNGSVSLVALRGKFALNWMLFPQWTPCLDPLLRRHTDIIEYGGLALAHMVVDQLSAVAVGRDLGQLRVRFPAIGRLVAGELRLADLGDPPPGCPAQEPPAACCATGESSALLDPSPGCSGGIDGH